MKKVFLFLTMLLFAFVGTMRADELTACAGDGTVYNSYVPVYGYYADAYLRCQYVMPAEELADMAGGTINQMTFFTKSAAAAAWTGTFQVYMTEVTDATISAFIDPANATTVYTGLLDATGETMVVVFDEAYTYNGGNLLIGFDQTETGNYKSASFYGISATGCCVQGYSYSDLASITATQRDFLPKTLFEFTPGGGGGEPATLTVYDGENTNSYVPVYGFYADSYLRAQYVIPAADLAEMNGGTVNQLTFYMTAPAAAAWTGSFEVYMTEVEDATISAFVDPANATTVYAGLLDATGETMVVTFTDTYVYNGGNLLIGFDEVETGNYKSVTFAGTTVEGASVQGYSYSSVTAVSPTQRNFIPKTTFDYITGGGPAPVIPTNIVTVPEVLDLGYRPIGYWMEPYAFQFKNLGGNATINQVINGSNAFMTVDLETPAVIEKGETVDATITAGTANAGNITEQFAIDYTGARSLKMFEMSAIAYEAGEGDVWELANEVTVPFTGNAPAGIKKNYNIPGATATAADAMYKVTLENDVMFTATAADGVTALYKEDFGGEGGPMAENAYVYNGPEINPGPVNTWFSYAYTGSNTFFGTSAGGGMIYGYMIPGTLIQQLGYEGLSLRLVEAAAREAYPYDLYIFKGGATPDAAELVYYQEMGHPATAMYFFDLKLDTPVVLDSQNLWVMFYSESPYAAYCGKVPTNADLAKIWYTTNGTTWYSNTTYTPVIYANLREMATGRDIKVNLADLSAQAFNGGNMVEIAGEAAGNTHVAPEAPRVNNMFTPAGTYYVAAASATDNFAVTMSTTAAPAPVQAVLSEPADGDTGYTDDDMFVITLGNYTKEFQILLGTEYPPVTPLIDWTDHLVETGFLNGLQNNKIYFMQVNARNDSGVTYGDIIGFTSAIDPVEGFAAEATELYPGESAVFSWNANRSIKGYNLYMDGEKLNETLITGTTYSVDSLEYNMDEEGYAFQVSSVYDEGESELSDPIFVNMTGYGIVSGTVYEQDSITPVPFATVMMVGVDEYGVAQTFSIDTDENGEYSGEIFAGLYTAYGYKDGYQVCQGDEALVLYGEETENVNVVMYEIYYPLGQIDATEVEDNVEVTWSWTPAEYIVDFEDGAMPAEFTSTSTHPWAITTTNPYEGTYCIKSTCEGVASATSFVEATVDVPYDAKMGFYVRVSSETNYDKFHFYIDGVEQGQAISGQQPYAYKEYTVAAGTHTYKWAYQKDSSVNSNDDCAYVDYITMYRKDEPLPPTPGGQTFNFDDGTMMGWTSIDADGDGYGWVSGAEIGGVYLVSGASLAGSGHNASEGLVCSGSYSNATSAALTPDNYLVSPTPISAQNGAAISFWACGQDASYVAEHFGVAVSTTTATASAFTTIQEWTMTAKRSAAMEADEAPNAPRGTRAQGSWYQYTVDLSSYAGQDIYVAIRHFNCTDMFILDVDDITLGDGSVKAPERGTRALNEFRLYRRNNNVEEPVAELIGTFNDTTFAYTDAAWATLPFGVYQWGIQAYYEGNATPQDRGEITIGSGEETNTYIPVYPYYNYSVSEQIYTAAEIGTAGTINSISFFNTANEKVRDIDVYMINTDKAEFASTTDWVNVTAADMVYTGTVTFYVGEWTTIELDNAFAYDGTSNLMVVCVDHSGSWSSAMSCLAFDSGVSSVIYAYNDNDAYDPTALTATGHLNAKKNQIKLDITAGPVSHDGLSEVLWSNEIEKDMYSTVTVNVTLNNGQAPYGAAVALTGENTYNAVADETGVVVIENVRKGAYNLAVTMDGYTSYELIANVTEDAVVYNAVLNEIIAPVDGLYVSPTGYAMWDGNEPTPGPGPGPQPGQGQWYYYDNGVNDNNIGASGQFYWAVMFPAGQYTGDYVTKVATYDSGNAGYAFTGTATIYQGGTTAPGTAVGTVDVATTGATADFVEYEFAEPVNIDATQNLWVVFYNATSTSYCATAYAESGSGNANARWVSLDGSSWMDLATAGISGYGWMLRVYVAEGAKGEVHEITVPTQECNNAGALSMVPVENSRFALNYKVMLDGVIVGETTESFYQFDVTGMEEGSEHVAGVAPVYVTGMGEYTYYTWTYAGCGAYEGATEFTGVANNGNVTLTWEIEGGTPGPNPPTPPTPGQDETYDFDNSTMQGWTTIDANNDGYDWVLGSQIGGVYLVAGASLAGSGHNSSNDLVCSGSYSNATSAAITPNNFLVSPNKGAYTGVSFFACGQDASYVAEHFGVAVSTGSNTNANDFTIVQEWTMTAKNQGAMSIGRDGQTRAQGSWHEYTVDLSAYAGQQIWVAIRHFNCSDMFILDVDDITLTAAAKGRTVLYEPHFVTDPGAMANGGDASWIKGTQSTYGPGAQFSTGNIVADDFTLTSASTITEIEVYGYQTGSTTTSTFTGLYAVIYNGNPMNGGQIVWGDMNTNIMTSTSFTNAYRGNGDASGTTRPIMALTASNLNIALEAGTYYLAWNMAGSGSSGPWAQPEALPEVGNNGDGVQYLASSSAWQNLTDTGASTPYGVAFKLVGEGGGPVPPTPTGNVLGVNVYRDGEFLTMAAANAPYVDENLAEGTYEYCIEVVYDDYGMSCPQCITVEVGAASCDPVTNLTAVLHTQNGSTGCLLSWDAPAGAVSYNLYQVEDGQVYTIAEGWTATSVFLSGFEEAGIYTFGVTAVYANCESEMETVDFEWLSVDENEIVSAIYPNPTSDDLHINATAMTQISVYNAMGQMVYNQAVNADEMVINMGQFEAGVYMVRIDTENGSSVKRITVVK